MSSLPKPNTPILSTTKLSNKLIIPSSQQQQQHILLTPLNDENKCLKPVLAQNLIKNESSSSSKQDEANSSDSTNLLDDSLTSLQWLQHLNVMKSATSKAAAAEAAASATASETSTQDLSKKLADTPTSNIKISCISLNESKTAQNSSPSPNSTLSQPQLLQYRPLSPPLSTICSPSSSSSSSSSCSSFSSSSTSNKTAKQPNTIKPPLTIANLTNGTASPQTKRANNSANKLAKQASVVLAKEEINTESETRPQLQHQQSAPAGLQSSNFSYLKEREEFRTNCSIKPPYSYSQLIILSMKESSHAKMTLQMIYDWIIENFSYFKKADPAWQITFKNSIRHNLSLNKCFKKIARQKDEPGKGGFWTLDPEFEKQLNESSFSIRLSKSNENASSQQGNGNLKTNIFNFKRKRNNTNSPGKLG